MTETSRISEVVDDLITRAADDEERYAAAGDRYMQMASIGAREALDMVRDKLGEAAKLATI